MLAETAAEAAVRFGAAPAFVTDDGLTISYEQFDTLADEAAVGLAELGVGEGDVVGLLLPTLPEHFIAYVAAAKLGAVTAAVNPKLVQSERVAVLRAANPLVVITTGDLAPSEPDAPFTTLRIAPALQPGCGARGCAPTGGQARAAGARRRPARGDRLHLGHDRDAERSRVLRAPDPLHHPVRRR